MPRWLADALRSRRKAAPTVVNVARLIWVGSGLGQMSRRLRRGWLNRDGSDSAKREAPWLGSGERQRTSACWRSPLRKIGKEGMVGLIECSGACSGSAYFRSFALRREKSAVGQGRQSRLHHRPKCST